MRESPREYFSAEICSTNSCCESRPGTSIPGKGDSKHEDLQARRNFMCGRYRKMASVAEM